MRWLAGMARLAASVAVAALVIAACAARRGSQDVGVATARVSDAVSLTLSLSAPPSAGEPIEFRLVASNAGPEEAVLDFADGQRFDFEVFRGETRVWQWSADMFFPMMIGRERIAPGGSIPWSVTLEDGLPAGSYRVRATLTTADRPVVDLEFTVGA